MVDGVQHQRSEHELHDTTAAQFLEKIVVLWEQLATELGSIIGDGGFRILFTRSASLASEKFSWLENCPVQLQEDSPALYFKTCFTGREIVEMRNANALIVSAFTDTLASLVGNPIAANLVRPAWDQLEPANTSTASRHLKRDPQAEA